MIQIEMEMVDKCSECRFRTDYYFCSAMPKNFCGNTSDEGKPDWCPLKNADGWISVKDRMPEKYFDVLVFVQYPKVNGYTGHYVVIAWKSTDDDSWDSDDNNFNNDPEGVVTHWMPLPSTEGLNEA